MPTVLRTTQPRPQGPLGAASCCWVGMGGCWAYWASMACCWGGVAAAGAWDRATCGWTRSRDCKMTTTALGTKFPCMIVVI